MTDNTTQRRLVTRTVTVRRRLASVGGDRSAEDLAEREARGALPEHIDELCWAWARWCETRRYFGPPPNLPSLLGRVQRVAGRPGDGGPDAALSAQLAALHLAIIGQPVNALDRCVFEVHYRYRPKSVKHAAALLGIGRQHWYTLRNSFARRVYSVHHHIIAQQASEKVSPPEATTLSST